MATQKIVQDIRGVCPVCGGELEYEWGSLVMTCPRCEAKKLEAAAAFARAKASAGKVQVWGGQPTLWGKIKNFFSPQRR